MGRVSIKGVLLGVGTDIGGSIVAGVLLLSWFGGSNFSANMSPDEIDEVVKRITQNGTFLITSFVIGLSLSAVGGYVAARIAGKDYYLNSGLVGVVGVLAGLLSLSNAYPIWFNVGGLILIVPAALYGGRLAESRAGK